MDQMSRKMLDQVCRTYRDAVAVNSEFAQTAQELHFERMIALIEDQLRCQQQLEEYRRRSLWVFQPGAWKARNTRNAIAREIQLLKKDALERVLPASLIP